MVITYRGLVEAIETISERIQRYEFDTNEPVAVAINHPVRQLAVCFALLRCGITAAPISRGTLPFLRPNGITHTIYAGEGQILSGGRNIRFEDSWLRRDGKATPAKDLGRPSFAASTDLIFFTSGTTGAPKKMVVPSGAVMERVGMLPIIGDANFDRTLIVPNLASLSASCAPH
jgi:acyl-coenzyme A synthetase/AMP-(fatty) acid ligase